LTKKTAYTLANKIFGTRDQWPYSFSPQLKKWAQRAWVFVSGKHPNVMYHSCILGPTTYCKDNNALWIRPKVSKTYPHFWGWGA